MYLIDFWLTYSDRFSQPHASKMSSFTRFATKNFDLPANVD